MTFAVGLLVGSVIGATLGAVIMAACRVGSEADFNDAEAEQVRLQRCCWRLRCLQQRDRR